MAPWSWWSQSTSQQQKERQEEPPPSSSPSFLKRSSPSLSQTPTPPSTEPSSPKTQDAVYRKRPSSTELWQIGTKSLQTGMVTGGIGLLFGAGTGIVRSAPPTIFALFAGFQWFTLGSSYMASRGLLCHALGGEENLSSPGLVKVSGMAGGVAGMVGGMIRGPKNILPGMLFFGTLGAGSSYLSQLTQGTESGPKTSWLDSKWSPMQPLSDQDYIDKVEEKILRLDAEIAIIDENIASLKASSQSPDPSTEPTSK
ncbi:hypothetical protein E0Z10_g4360 [Xylaria hypoxylon]|uniref:Uncharacterized protein n=1 Tax=Xylaria hypoxylon TaxID=37992 RepID=A0A4Z0YYY3_9PEZI|nr:hypothetical protein E0Z10_g4360 [Xylaria hypoxylon]